MNNAELIKALRCESNEYGDCSGNAETVCEYKDRMFCDYDRMMRDAADALEADEMRIAELEAQLPKEGAWIIDGMNEYELSYGCVGYEPIYRCSKCGITTESYLRTERPIMPEDADFPNYCPYCGARMRGVNDE